MRSPPILTDGDETNDVELCLQVRHLPPSPTISRHLPPSPYVHASDVEPCLQPYIAKEPSFDAVAFETPDGSVSVVAMNKGDDELTFTLYDASLSLGALDVLVPPHSIQSYTLPAKGEGEGEGGHPIQSYSLPIESDHRTTTDQASTLPLTSTGSQDNMGPQDSAGPHSSTGARPALILTSAHTTEGVGGERVQSGPSWALLLLAVGAVGALVADLVLISAGRDAISVGAVGALVGSLPLARPTSAVHAWVRGRYGACMHGTCMQGAAEVERQYDECMHEEERQYDEFRPSSTPSRD